MTSSLDGIGPDDRMTHDTFLNVAGGYKAIIGPSDFYSPSLCTFCAFILSSKSHNLPMYCHIVRSVSIPSGLFTANNYDEVSVKDIWQRAFLQHCTSNYESFSDLEGSSVSLKAPRIRERYFSLLYQYLNSFNEPSWNLFRDSVQKIFGKGREIR